MSLASKTLIKARQFKPAWALYQLPHWRQLRSNSASYKKLGIRRSVLGSISHRDISNPSSEVPWLDRPDARQALTKADVSKVPEPIRAKLPSWIDDGFLVLDRFFDEDRIDAINTDIANQMEARTIGYLYRGNRVPNAFRKSQPIRDALADPGLIGLLSFLLGREAMLFQTINFFEGSEQRAHSDSFHMTTEPLGYLIGVWVALEDVEPDSGPVFYYPGSHRLPYVMTEDLDGAEVSKLIARDKGESYVRKMAEVIEEQDLEPVDFLPRKGDVLLWHANLIHGGRGIETPGTTRKSLVAHYLAKGVLCYHETTERPALIET